ncbi:MAG: alpha/beta hydrolase [Frankiales bacterium]|nr:alpha/beta hydrolase [Frankiales bacterium]
MALTWKARTALAVARGLAVVGLAPTTERALKMPMAKRLSTAPGKGMLGKVPEVPWEDSWILTRDGAQVRVRVYRPAGATIPMLYCHGGGFAVGGIPACDHICRRLAVESGAIVCSVEYRLAPEHPFPGPLQDCEDALDWFLEQDLGQDLSQLVVAGDSAGGNLAAALALVLRDRGTPLAGQLLIYPTLDLTISGKGINSYGGKGGLKAADCRAVADLYLTGGGDPTDPLASPLLAPDLAGLAPALVITVEHDPLREEGGLYVGRLLEAGVSATLIDVLDHLHASLSLPVLYVGIDELYARMSAFVRQPHVVPA